jgi:transposase
MSFRFFNWLTNNRIGFCLSQREFGLYLGLKIVQVPLEQKVTYAGIKQRWLIVESAERKQSDIQKLNSKIEQEKKTVLKLGKKLETTGFDTVTQAQNYLKSINKKLKLWHLESLEIKSKKINKQSIFYHYQIETKPRVSEIERRTVGEQADLF